MTPVNNPLNSRFPTKGINHMFVVMCMMVVDIVRHARLVVTNEMILQRQTHKRALAFTAKLELARLLLNNWRKNIVK